LLGGFSLCQLCAVEEDTDRVDGSRREIEFTVDSGACRTVVPRDHPAVRGYRVHKDSTTGVSYGTAAKHGKKIVDEGKRILQTKTNGAGVPQRLNTRKADVGKALLAVCEMVDAKHTVLFDSSGSYAVNKVTGVKTPFLRKGNDWHLKLTLEAPDKANKVMSQILAEMRELRKVQIEAAVEPEVTLQSAGGIGSRAPDGSQKVNDVAGREQGAPQKAERVEPLFRMAVGG
jgi:hypothetical protein